MKSILFEVIVKLSLVERSRNQESSTPKNYCDLIYFQKDETVHEIKIKDQLGNSSKYKTHGLGKKLD